MTFQPIVPIGGYIGWNFLQRTLPAQQESFQAAPEITRDVAHVRAELGNVVSAEELVGDRQLLKVALGAYGLQDDLNNKAFIQQILEGGTEDSSALANRLADKRYYAFAEAFGFGDGGIPAPQQPDFAEQLIDDYYTRSFEIAVGDVNNDMRLAFTLEREITELAASASTEDTKWFTLMGNPPLRQVFETALGLPDGFGTLDIDQQLEVFQDRLFSATGSSDISQFTDADSRADMVQLFLLRSEIRNGPSANTPGMAALTILSSVSSPSSGLLQTALFG